MHSRRRFLQRTTGFAAAPALLQSCIADAGLRGYEAAANNTWRSSAAVNTSKAVIYREMVRMASLAPSSHNTQCWQFAVAGNSILITPDLTRSLPIVDPDNHHLFVSLGCATENMMQAAMAFGLQGEVHYENISPVIHVNFEPSKAVVSPSFSAITERQCTRSVFDRAPVSSSELRLLESAGNGVGVRAIIFTERTKIDEVLGYVIEANTKQMNDPKFITELKQWIRFNGDDTESTGDGLSSITLGNPSIPAWLGNRIFNLMVTAKNENDKYAAQMQSSSGIAIFVSEVNDHKHWVEVGRCYERFALLATTLGIRNAFINQPVEVAAVRDQLTSFLGINQGRVDLVVRFGRAGKMPRSLRRPVADVITVEV